MDLILGWIQRKLLPGHDWEHEIKQAIDTSDYFLALLSSASVNKRGFVQKELRLALDVLDEYPDSDIFLIPVRLDDCQLAQKKFADLHWVDLFPSFETGINKIMQVVSRTKI